MGNLSGFQKVCKSELHQLHEDSKAIPSQRMKSVFFYDCPILYWYKLLNGGKASMLVRAMGVINHLYVTCTNLYIVVAINSLCTHACTVSV